MSHMHQIHEQDLSDLECLIPKLCESIELTNATKAKMRVVKRILSDVRWNYGPHDEVETISAGGDDE